ncbi:MAG: caspase family protein [Gemmatimonadaceae bacterium]|nr:caspase family protein [Gemmatimonadaceae bacterium]
MARLLLVLTFTTAVGLPAQTVSRGPSHAPKRYAVLLGINEYPAGVPTLKGSPLNDVELMRDLLVKRLGFPVTNIITLMDRQVTRTNVIATIRQHLGQAGVNDVALLYYSGHGIQVNDSLKPRSDGATEPDSLDEALLLWDSDEARATYLLDDELGLLLDELPARRTIAIIDACHSGSATRASGDDEVFWSTLGKGAAPRLPERIDDARAAFLPRRVLLADTRNVIVAPETLLTTGASVPQRGHLLLSAALDGEVALGGPITMPDGTRRPLGLFTTALNLAIQASNQRTTMQEIIVAVRRAVSPVARRIQGAPQTPGATGAWTMETLHQVLEIPAPPRIRRPGGRRVRRV